jgi:agmatinase
MTENKTPRVNTGKIVGQVDATQMPRYGGIATFAHLPHISDVTDVDVAIVGVPFDTGVSYRPGARFGPNHVRESSRLLRPYNPAANVSPFATQQVVDAGDIAANPFDIEEAISSIHKSYDQLAERAKRIVTIGGDHTITLPILRSLKAKHGPISVVHFDAHLDTWDSYFGADYTHGTTFRRASEEGLLDPEGCMHIGIRGPLYAAKDLTDDKALGFQIFSSVEFQDLGVKAAIEKMKARVANRPVYISIDIDVLDPAHAPGTGTPEAGGLTSRELLSLLRATAGMTVIGADIVEVAPAYDHAQITGIAASHAMYELISAFAAKQ